MAGWEHVAMGERVNRDGSKLDGKTKAWHSLCAIPVASCPTEAPLAPVVADPKHSRAPAPVARPQTGRGTMLAVLGYRI